MYLSKNDSSLTCDVNDDSGNTKSEENGGLLSTLKAIKLNNVNRISIGQLNINSLRNKFEFLREAISGYVDILLITETKLDNSFPCPQFHIKGYSTPYRRDRNAHGGGILLYNKEGIPF